MSNIAEIDEIRDAVSLMSVDFYHASSALGWIDENTELLRGIPVEKMSKSPEHEYLVDLFLELIRKILPENCFVVKERPITTPDSEPEPDLMVVEGERSDFRKSHPNTAKLIIEVAINTEKRDLEKSTIYAEANVDEYWLVVPSKKQIKVQRRSNGTEYEQVELVSDGTVVSEVLDGLSVDVPGIFD